MKALSSMALMALAALTLGCNRSEQTPVSPADRTAQQATAPAHDSHDEHAQHAPAPVLPAGQRWPTDEPLRSAMSRIRTAVEEAVPAYEHRQLSAAQAQGLAKTVQENIAYMIANCKLQPEPDAALHGLIARMNSAAAVLQEDPAREQGVPSLVAVLHDYQASFDHPGWPPLTAH